MKLHLATLFIVLAWSFAAAQTAPYSATGSGSSAGRESGRDPSQQDLGIPDDMRARLAIERAESEHRKALEDVDKLNDLSEDLARRYRESGTLSDAELKKLAAIEKLAKRILSHAGGSEVDEEGAAPQLSVAEAVGQLSTAVSNIKKSMTAETRFVVSALVIANSNEVINLAQFIRRSAKQ